MRRITLLLSVLVLLSNISVSQDTFSIVAVDSASGEVGSAGASCVDLTLFPSFTTDFLGELFPGVGAINTQAYYIGTNQVNARNQMLQGATPAEIIAYMIANDVQGTPQLRQYGVAAFDSTGAPTAAAHTGASTDPYRGDRVGSNYSIQGNILQGAEILDSMESRFVNAEGDLACKLMAAMQGANVIGADTRCGIYGTSSLFAFLKVAQPNDVFGSPSYLISVRTASSDGIEPIDSLQSLFDSTHNCTPVNPVRIQSILSKGEVEIYPNPTQNELSIHLQEEKSAEIFLFDIYGHELLRRSIIQSIKLDLSEFEGKAFFIRTETENQSSIQRIIRY